MKRGNLEFGVLIAVVAVAALGAIFMFSTNNEASAMASYGADPQFTEQQSDCLMGCYQNVQTESRNNDYPSRQRLASCLAYCQQIPK